MSARDSERLVGAYIEEAWNRGDLQRLEQLTTPAFTYHLNGQAIGGRDAFRRFVAAMREAFPDWHVEVDDVIADDGGVAVRWHGRATHLGPFRGIAATGRTVQVTGVNVYTIEDGRIASEWEQMDSLGMLQQLGVLPS